MNWPKNVHSRVRVTSEWAVFHNEENTRQSKCADKNYYNGYFTRSGWRNQCYVKEKAMDTKMDSNMRWTTNSLLREIALEDPKEYFGTLRMTENFKVFSSSQRDILVATNELD